ncbi:LOW QUALITY PROTEIN: uncharacterized protein A1O9_12789 [Exophiala aquamarina CBS 119918]|uniref:Uncharacterized protein n=1 Tax=Exophiala aquamarina CBS 119918 TaxID=1182545 RepID=A0A072P6C8_9EURO|nr:LOW QUALITY PROTEIN: uncharacterized protein A1O9_12789 [Exophiala aquamarina CBS 119918]KEF51175.1 LOW QUALITY PROTEIN: hypothetical protein A1O9_12789 [Exophiala aquamarina CBS 119918]
MDGNPSLIVPSGHGERSLRSGHIINFATFTEALESLFDQAIASLNRLSSCIKGNRNPEAATTVRGLRDLVRIVQDRRMEFNIRDQFRLVYPYSTFMKPLSSSFLSMDESEPFLIATLAHLFAVNILLVFPAINVAAFIPTQLRSLSAIGAWFKLTPRITCDTCDSPHQSSELITFPMNTIAVYQQWQKQL